MRSPAVRAGIAVAAVALAVVLFVVLAGADDPGTDAVGAERGSAQAAAGGQSRASSTTQPESAPDESGRSASERAPRIQRIVVRGGRPVGGVARLEYESGEHVRFSVRSDVADEIHVHGFDITKDVPAKGSVRFAFPAEIEGVFDVELHHADVKIAELRITP